MKYDLWYEFIPVNRTSNASYDELVAGVPEVYHAAAGDISIRSKRLANASFTEPFLPSDITQLVRLKREHTEDAHPAFYKRSLATDCWDVCALENHPVVP